MEDRELNDRAILTVDPGVTSGFVLAFIESDRVQVAPFQLRANCYKLYTLLDKIMPRTIICEDFEIRTSTEPGTELYSVQLIGVINCFVESFGRYDAPKIYMQKAAHMKTGFFGYQKDGKKKIDIGAPKLKELGIYKPGENFHHSMDAMRHFMQWLKFGAGFQYGGLTDLELIEPSLVEPLSHF